MPSGTPAGVGLGLGAGVGKGKNWCQTPGVGKGKNELVSDTTLLLPGMGVLCRDFTVPRNLQVNPLPHRTLLVAL